MPPRTAVVALAISIGLTAAAVCHGSVFRSRRMPRCRRVSWPLAVAVAVAIVPLGGLALGAAASRPPEAARLADHPRGAQGPWRVRGRLRTDPMRTGSGWVVDLGADAVFVDGTWREWPLRVRTTVYETDPQPDWIAGDHFEAFLRLRPDRPPRNPLVGVRPSLRASGADVRSSLKSFRQLRRRPGGTTAARRLLAAARMSVRRATATQFQTHAPLVNALLLGERGEIPGALLNAMARTGLIHVIAISGLHVGIFIAVVFAMLRAAGMAIPRAAIGCLLMLPMIYAFVVPRPAVARACIMAAAILGGVALGRRTSAFSGLALATLVLTFRDPWVARDVGFQLSTAATAAILVVGPPGRASNRVSRAVVGSLLVSCAAQVGVAPMLAAATHRLPLVAVPLNLVAVPAVGVVIVVAVGTLAAAAVGADLVAHAGAALAGAALDTLEALVGAVDAPGRSVLVPAAAVGWLLPSAFVAIALLAAGNRAAAQRSSAFGSLLGGAFALALIAAVPTIIAVTTPYPRPSTGHIRLVVLDIGQGDALVVETPQETVLVDTGGSPTSDFDPGAAVIAPALRARGSRSLDAVAITHFHADHAGGVRGVLAELPTRQVWAPSATANDPASARFAAAIGDTPVVTLAGGDLRRVGECTWRVLHPSGRWLESGGAPVSNNGSLVLALACGGRQILLTGDTERAAELDYAGGSSELRSMVLKSPHHGSSTSSTSVLLDRIDARHAVISVGWRNRFGLPSSEVLERYRKRQIAVYRTDRDGAVSIDVGSRIRVRAERWSAGRGRERRGGWLH